MSQYGYGGGRQQNPYGGQQNNGYGGGGGGGGGYGGGANRYNQGGRQDDYGAQPGVEMSSFGQGGGAGGNIFSEIDEINRGVDTIDRNLTQLKMLQQRALDDSDSSGQSGTNRQLDSLSTETMAHYRSLTERVRQLKSKPEAQQAKYAPQVGRVDRRLKQAIQTYQQVESTFRKRTQDQMARQYRIVRPDATESEVQAAVEDQTGGQVFQQALMQSNRRGQAQQVLSAVQDRHAQLQKIEQQMIELAQLFQDMDTLVVQQDVAVEAIEQKGEEVVENIDKGNEHVGTAINSARAARKKKWYCLIISIVILLIIVAAVVGWYFTMGPGGQKAAAGGKKRSLAPRGLEDWVVEVVSHPTEVKKTALQWSDSISNLVPVDVAREAQKALAQSS